MLAAQRRRSARATYCIALTRKQRGQLAEAAFPAIAARLGFRVSKPWGESSRYDFILDNGRRLLRVQVKSAHRADGYGGYTFAESRYRSSSAHLSFGKVRFTVSIF